MKRHFLLFLLTVSCVVQSAAQYTSNQNKRWAFGNRAGVSFITGTPVAFTHSMNAVEGTTTISDASGNLLFYSEGSRVWNRTGAVMPSGSAIVPFSTASATQACQSVPVIGNPNQYYIFSLEGVPGGANYCKLAYCKVDMTLDGGLGDVIASTINTPVTDRLSEKMVAVPGNNCDIWLIVHRKDSAVFLAYNITAAGISGPVRSTVGTFTTVGSYGGYSIGAVKVSHDRRKIVTANWNSGGSMGCELHDFNATTGIVSGCVVLDSTSVQYGAEFSADDSKLYLQTTSNIYQYDLSLGTAAAIRASRYTVGGSVYWSGLRIGPDDKIYFGGPSSSWLGAINNPNVAGAGCGYTGTAVALTSGTSFSLGLPSLFVTVGTGDSSYSRHDTTACVPTGGSILISGHDSGSSYTWNDGVTTRTRSITSYGTYWVSAQDGCTLRIDTIVVSQPILVTTTNVRSATVCDTPGSSYTMVATAGLLGRIWYDGSGAATRTVTASGTYWVRAYDVCQNPTIDTFHIVFENPDTTINTSHYDSACVLVAPFILTAPSGHTSYLWSSGATTSTYGVPSSPLHSVNWVYSRTGCAVSIDTFVVGYAPLPIVNIGNDTAFCIGNTIVLSSVQPLGYTYLWSTGSHDDSIHVSTTGTYWLRVENGCSVTDSIHILISPYPVVNLGPDVMNCTGTPVTLSSSTSYSTPVYTWSTGAATSAITVPTSGTYWLNVWEAGCGSTDTVMVTIYYDTFTLYNRDTAICRGRSVQAFLTANPFATFQWLPTAGIPFSTSITPLITPDTSAMYHVNIYIVGCPPVSDSFFIEVQPNPSVYIGGNRFICEFDTIHINSYVSPSWFSGYQYSWSPTTSLDFGNTPNVVFTAGATDKYVLTVRTSAGCEGKDSAQLTVNPGNFAVPIPDQYMCPGDSVHMIAGGGADYRWYPSIYVDDSTSSNPWIRAITTQTYRVIAYSAAGCRDTVFANVTVYPNGVIFMDDSVYIHPGESYQLTPMGNCAYYSWFPPAGLSDPTISNPIATPEVSTRYIVTGTTSNGCKGSDTISVNVRTEAEIALPNAFTPGTGVNNKLTLMNRGLASLLHFRIYNRWGNVVFETRNINEGWDGTYNGQPQPFGVYVYDIEALTDGGKLKKMRGNVTLLR